SLYFLLSGQVPFPGGTLIHKVMAHIERQPTPLPALRPELPAELARVVERMMAKDPGRRYQTPAEVVQALAPFTGQGGVPALPQKGPADIPATSAGTVPAAPVPTPVDWACLTEPGPTPSLVPTPARARPPWLAFAVAGSILGVLLLAGVLGLLGVLTDSGELVLQGENADVEVIVRRRGQPVATLQPKGEH